MWFRRSCVSLIRCLMAATALSSVVSFKSA
jgi:hypothetical protein